MQSRYSVLTHIPGLLLVILVMGGVLSAHASPGALSDDRSEITTVQIATPQGQVTRYQAALALERLCNALFSAGIARATPRTLGSPTGPLLAVLCPSAIPKQNHHPTDFKDVSKDTWTPFPMDLVEAGVLSGYPDGFFHGKRPLTRGECLLLLTRLLAYLPSDPPMNRGSIRFPDVSGGEWWFGAEQWVVGAGILTAYPDHTFHGERPVTFQEFVKALQRLQDLSRLAHSGDTISRSVQDLSRLAHSGDTPQHAGLDTLFR